MPVEKCSQFVTSHTRKHPNASVRTDGFGWKVVYTWTTTPIDDYNGELLKDLP
jgi:hypothetical protein